MNWEKIIVTVVESCAAGIAFGCWQKSIEAGCFMAIALFMIHSALTWK